MKNQFIFLKELNKEELNFWATFFDYFPCHHNRYFQSVINHMSKQVPGKETINIDSWYEILKDCKTNDDMINLFLSKHEWSEPIKKCFPKIINTLNKIVPNSKPIELFLLSIYGGSIQDWDLETSSKGINFIGTESKDLERKTYVPQLAMIADLISGRLNEIFPNIQIKPNQLIGEVYLTTQENKEGLHFLAKESNKNSYYSSNFSSTKIIRSKKSANEENYNVQFQYDFSQNTDDHKECYAPLLYEQVNLLKLIQKHYLSSSLDSKKSLEKRMKI